MYDGWHSLEIIALPPSEGIYFYTPTQNGWNRESNRALEVPTLVMLLYVADHLRSSGLKVREYLGRMAEVEIEMSTLGAFLRTVRRKVFNCSAMDNMTRVYGSNGVLIPVFRGTFHHGFATATFSFSVVWTVTRFWPFSGCSVSRR